MSAESHESNSHSCSWAPSPDARVTANTGRAFTRGRVLLQNALTSLTSDTLLIKRTTSMFGETRSPEMWLWAMWRGSTDPDDLWRAETSASVWNKGFTCREHPVCLRRGVRARVKTPRTRTHHDHQTHRFHVTIETKEISEVTETFVSNVFFFTKSRQ